MLVFYRCIPEVVVDVFDQLGLTDQDNKPVNATEVKEGLE